MTRSSAQAGAPPAIGVTGHRPNRMHIGKAELARRLLTVLAAVRQGARHAGRGRLRAISSLAEGTDRIFADEALAQGFHVTALLPFARNDYETTFSDTAETSHYRALLDAAADVVELPGTLADTRSAYEAVGRAMVDASAIVIAVWDGKPAAGRGGTPEIIAYALAHGKPVIWIDGARARLPRLIAAPAAQGRRAFPLDKLASRARPLTRARIIRLAARTLAG